MDDVMASQDVVVQEPVAVAGEQGQDGRAAARRGTGGGLRPWWRSWSPVPGSRAWIWPGENGLLGQLTKLVLESALEGEITDHLGYEPHERGGSAEGNAP